MVEYSSIAYVPETDDPSLEIRSGNLVAKVIDNTGLLLPARSDGPLVSRHGGRSPAPFSHHLGYHGLRTVYAADERRNLVAPFFSWLNLQTVELAGIENDPVDSRAAYGVGRGWPLRLDKVGKGARLTLDPLPRTQFAYSIEFQPAPPNGITFTVRFVFHRHPDHGRPCFRATWPCYMSVYDDVRFFYPHQDRGGALVWDAIGAPPDMIIGEPVGYEHRQTTYRVEQQAYPLGYGLIGRRALSLMFDDPSVTFFVVNAGGHLPFSPVQNPAWDFEWVVEDYPLETPIGFRGMLQYGPFPGPDGLIQQHLSWINGEPGSLAEG